MWVDTISDQIQSFSRSWLSRKRQLETTIGTDTYKQGIHTTTELSVCAAQWKMLKVFITIIKYSQMKGER